MGQRPTHAVTTGDLFLGCILDELEAQGKILADILDRLPAPDQGAGSPAPDAEPQRIDIAEPVPEREPARKTAPAKKAATKAVRR